MNYCRTKSLLHRALRPLNHWANQFSSQDHEYAAQQIVSHTVSIVFDKIGSMAKRLTWRNETMKNVYNVLAIRTKFCILPRTCCRGFSTKYVLSDLQVQYHSQRATNIYSLMSTRSSDAMRFEIWSDDLESWTLTCRTTCLKTEGPNVLQVFIMNLLRH